MHKHSKTRSFYRIIDANINRAKEGLRVTEEFTRFILNTYRLTRELKNIRHNLESATGDLRIKKHALIEERNTRQDVGKKILAGETRRNSYLDIVMANLGRAKESMRVLEEFSKLINAKAALSFKEIRYCLYNVEKKIILLAHDK